MKCVKINKQDLYEFLGGNSTLVDTLAIEGIITSRYRFFDKHGSYNDAVVVDALADEVIVITSKVTC